VLHAGTALGCVRENDIIKDDTDVDIIIMQKDYVKLSSLNFGGKTVFRKDASNDLARIFASDSNTLHIDVWIGQPSGSDFILNYCGKQYIFPMRFYNDQIDGTLRNQTFPIPRDYETLFIRHYGTDWMTPRPGNKGCYVTGKKYE